MLKRTFDALGKTHIMPTRVGGTRSLPRMLRAVENLSKAYPAIAMHMHEVNIGNVFNYIDQFPGVLPLHTIEGANYDRVGLNGIEANLTVGSTCLDAWKKRTYTSRRCTSVNADISTSTTSSNPSSCCATSKCDRRMPVRPFARTEQDCHVS